MNSTLTSHKERHSHQPAPPVETTNNSRGARRVGLVDRVALHLGVALITWSRRSRTERRSDLPVSHNRPQLDYERLAQARARDERNHPPFVIR